MISLKRKSSANQIDGEVFYSLYYGKALLFSGRVSLLSSVELMREVCNGPFSSFLLEVLRKYSSYSTTGGICLESKITVKIRCV